MLEIRTGTDGSGKTLSIIADLEKQRIKEDRKVLYWRIEGLKLDWEPLADHEDVEGARAAIEHLPIGALVCIDEAHILFPQRGPGTQPPPHVAQFAEHRHKGLDFFLLTQDARDLDHFVRRRVGRHIHFERHFKFPRSRRFQWERLGDPADAFDRKKATSSEFVFPKKEYGNYKSAEKHTMKSEVPVGPLIKAGIAASILGFGLFKAISLFGGDGLDTVGAPEQATTQVVQAQLPKLDDPETKKFRADRWLEQWKEVASGQPHSPDVYSQLMQPVAIPKISGCSHIQYRDVDRCECNTQQGTVIPSIDREQCLYYLAYGWFDPFKPDEEENSKDDDSRRASSGGGVRPVSANSDQITEKFTKGLNPLSDS